MKKYLEISIHDNDFWFSQELISKSIHQILMFMDYKNVSNETLPLLKKQIDQMWYSTYAFYAALRDGEVNLSPNYFDCDINIVNIEDVRPWDNSETLYVPLFDGAEPFIV